MDIPFPELHTLSIPWGIRVTTCVDISTKKHMIVIDNVAVMEVDREQVGLALEMVYATIRRIRDYDQTIKQESIFPSLNTV
jgi:hypothetical protein